MKFFIAFIIVPIVSLSQVQLSSEMHLNRGKEDFEEGFYLSAVSHLNQAIELDSSNADAYYYRGMCYKNGYKADFYPLCISDFAKCISLDSTENYSEAYLYLARAMGFFGKAFQSRFPAVLLIEEDVYKTAHMYYLKTFKLNPSEEFAEEIVQMYNYLLMGNYALEFNKLMLDKYPKNYNLKKSRAKIFMFQMDYDNAIEAYKELIKINRKDGDLYHDIVLCMGQKRYLLEKNIDMKYYCKMIKKAKKFHKTKENYLFCDEC